MAFDAETTERTVTRDRVMTQAEALRRFDYDPETGRLTYRIRPHSRVAVGEQVGTLDVHGGYLKTRIDGVRYQVHNLIWLMAYGELPTRELDHRDRNGLNNRLGNLRKTTDSHNNHNRALKSNSSGFRGVSFSTRNGPRPWRAAIRQAGRTKHLGYFATPEAAARAYDAAAIETHGDHAFPNFPTPERSITRDRVMRLRDFLKALPPEKFNMAEWGAPAQCGTPACIGGWAERVILKACSLGDYGWGDVGAALGLDEEKAYALFFPYDVALSGGRTAFRATIPEAVAVLDHYLATGEIDWGVAK
jgi:hypothetical protein